MSPERDTWSALQRDALRVLSAAEPGDDAERHRRAYVREVLEQNVDAASRHTAGPGHITCSAVVVDPDTRRLLLTLHPKFSRWMQLGGHFEPTDVSVASAVLREVAEESALRDVWLDPLLLGVGVFPDIPCPVGHLKEHLDIRFLVLATGDEDPVISDESLDLQWWPLDALPEPCDDDLRLLAQQAADRIHAR